MAKGQIKVGSYTGTGAAINVSIGFIPDYLHIVNVTDGTFAAEWFEGMTAGTAVELVNATSNVTSNGISRYLGTAGGVGAGFTAGTAYSTNAKVYRYIAIENS